MTAAEIVARVRSQFDVSDAEALASLNDRYKRLVGESQWLLQQVNLGTTAIDQATYTLPDNVADLRYVYVQDAEGPSEYSRVGDADILGLKTGRLRTSGSGGVFAPAYSSSGGSQVELYPAPDAAGSTVYGLGAVVPADLALADTPAVPVDFHPALVDGVIADLYARVDERLDLAQVHETRFVSEIERLRRRKNSRVGSGPQQIQVKGYAF